MIEAFLSFNRKYDLGHCEVCIALRDTADMGELKKHLEKISYKMHLYVDVLPSGQYKKITHISDFIRMVKFEHDLRSVLLKYCLMIEEVIKREFISYLNDSKKIVIV